MTGNRAGKLTIVDKIKAAIIGLGRIASLLEDDSLREKPCTHAGAIAANGDFLLVSGADIDEERRRLFAERWGVPVYDDAGEMLRAEAPRVLVIATHPGSHERYCRLAAAHRVPLVICEKPLAGSLGAARRIVRLARNLSRGGPVIMVNHERRYSLDYIRAREIIAEGRLGSLLSVDAMLYMGKKNRLLDVLWHDGTHLADAIMYLTGMRMKRGKSWGVPLASRRGTAWLAGTLSSAGRTKDKIPFVIELGAERDHLVFEMSFSFEQGRLRIGNGIFEVWESEPSPYAEKFRSLKKTVCDFTGPTGYFENMVKDAAACVQDPSRQPVSDAVDGLKVIEYLSTVTRWK
jgi:predicted dehydrogenase